MEQMIFAFDLDGTLLNSNKEIFADNITTINRAINYGHKVIIVTGRNYSQIQPYLKPLQQVQYFVTSNGGAIYDNFHHTMKFLAKPISQDIVDDFVIRTQNIKRELQFTNYDRLYRVYFGQNIKHDITEPDFFKDASKNPNYDKWEDVRDLLRGPIIRIAIRCEKTIREPLYLELLDKYAKSKKCNIAQSGNAYIECDGYSINKYHALSKVLTGKEVARMYYFGDSDNDLSIFRRIKNSVVMQNAAENIKKVAKHIIGDNNSLAIAEFLNKIL